jgi:hypothetical protein
MRADRIPSMRYGRSRIDVLSLQSEITPMSLRVPVLFGVIAGSLVFLPGCSNVSDSVAAATNAIQKVGKNVEEASVNIKDVGDKFDPVALKALTSEIKRVNEELNKRQKEIEAITDQLFDKVPMSITGTTYHLSSPKGEGPIGEVKHIKDNDFEFSVLAGGHKFTMTWDTKQQLFVGGKMRAFYFRDEGLIVFNDRGSYWYV